MTRTSLEYGSDGKQETRIDDVTDRFLNDPDELSLLQELRDEADERWCADGFAAPELFVDRNGHPILIASKETNEMDKDAANVYRFLHGFAVEDIVVPPALQGFTVETQGSGGYEGIYTLKPEEDPLSQTAGETEFAPVDIPPELEALRIRFGNKLGIEETDVEQGSVRSLVGEVDGIESWSAEELSAVVAKVEAMRQRINEDYDEANRLNREGQIVARRVGRFAAIWSGDVAGRRAAAFKAVVYGKGRKS